MADPYYTPPKYLGPNQLHYINAYKKQIAYVRNTPPHGGLRKIEKLRQLEQIIDFFHRGIIQRSKMNGGRIVPDRNHALSYFINEYIEARKYIIQRGNSEDERRNAEIRRQRELERQRELQRQREQIRINTEKRKKIREYFIKNYLSFKRKTKKIILMES